MPAPTPEQRKKNLTGCLRGCVVAGVVLAVAGGCLYWWGVNKDKEVAASQAKDAEFDRFNGEFGPPANAIDDAQARYRKGHVLLMNAKDGKVDHLFFTSLPAALRATSPADVGTKVWLTSNEQLVGKYDNGSEAYKSSYEVVVYDLARNAIVAREHIEGDDPPKTAEFLKDRTYAWRSEPVGKVMKFLQDLPAR